MRAWIYDRAILPLTTGYYTSVLARVPHHAKVLDIGIGTGGALCNNADLIRAKDLHLVGVDIDGDYVKKAQGAVAKHHLEKRVSVELVSIYDFNQSGFDAAYFSSSFMILPDPVAALQHVLGLLKPEGRIYFTQTFEDRKTPVMEKLKPVLKKVTTIEFGRVTYEEDFFSTLDRGGLHVVEHVKMHANRQRSGRLVVAERARVTA